MTHRQGFLGKVNDSDDPSSSHMARHLALITALLVATVCAEKALVPIQPPSCKPGTRAISTKGGAGLEQRLQIGFYFGLWYALNVLYNIQNKRVLSLVDLPWSVAVAQLAVGSLYSQTAWATIRAPPSHLLTAMSETKWIALFHGAGQACTVIALGASAVSSAHVVKALEPLFSALVSAIVFQKMLNPKVYASLLPVVAGVALAVAKDLSFSPVSFVAAMSSNLFFACRAVLSKSTMQTPGPHLADLSPASFFGVVTTTSTLMMMPVALIIEGPRFKSELAACLSRVEPATTPRALLGLTLGSGLFHYLNNEVMYLTLGKVHPITLAVGNTLKRIVIILASIIILGETMQPLAAFGAAVAIGGTFVYSIVKQRLG